MESEILNMTSSSAVYQRICIWVGAENCGVCPHYIIQPYILGIFAGLRVGYGHLLCSVVKYKLFDSVMSSFRPPRARLAQRCGD